MKDALTDAAVMLMGLAEDLQALGCGSTLTVSHGREAIVIWTTPSGEVKRRRVTIEEGREVPTA